MRTDGLLGLSGLYASPRKAPKTLVVFGHGYRKPATVYWDANLRKTAKMGALAVAMDYRGIGGSPDYRGWNIESGARDSITAGRFFLRSCPSIRRVVLVGVSMGGNVTGYALAAKAKRPGGGPLFDHWVNVEGAANVTETYLEASTIAPANAYAAGAKGDIERPMGGTLAQRPDEYRHKSIVNRAGDIAASDVKGVLTIHAVEDGLVPYDQAVEMVAALRQNGVPTSFWTITTRGEGEAGTTISGYATGPIAPSFQSPFAGHAAEESQTHVTMRLTFQLLEGLVKGGDVGDGNVVVLADDIE